MKKAFLALVAVVAIGTSTAFAQKAIGLRFGSGSLSGAEISYQQAMGGINRLEGDLGFSFGDHHSYISATGIYQWKWSIVNNLDWYAGVGASLGLYMHEYADDGFSLGIGGQIGVEYDFSSHGVPLNVSIDARPMWNFINYGGFNWNACLSVRYLF